MKKATIPNTTLEVSQLCIGTMTFGDRLDLTEAEKAIGAAVASGINFVDTADIYTIQNHGITEEILGQALKSYRKDVILATKVGGPMGPGADKSGLGRTHMIQGVNDSLRRLQTDYVDLLYFHFPDRKTAPEEMIESVNSLIREGKVRYYGISNFSTWEVCRLVMTAEKMGLQPPVVTQNVYNLLNRGIENELIPYTQHQGLGLTVFNPLAGGMLTGKYSTSAMPSGSRFSDNPGYKARYYNEKSLALVQQLELLARDAGMSLIELSLKWLLAGGNVHSVILGFSSTEQLLSNIGAVERMADAPIPFDEINQLWEAANLHQHPYHM